ncbi:MAG: methyltransferase domain-containing protein, partial [Desulfovibrionales bacterium]|nr:methyltransferase domain-containing protein [Desulfovibrionales bacterium]
RERARELCESLSLAMPFFLHGPIQELDLPHDFDLILCHAVVEWVVDPSILIRRLAERLAPGGILSLTFYNFHGMVFKNLLRGNYKKILREDYHGWPGSLTPAHPRKMEAVMEWVHGVDTDPLSLVCHSGMRVFHDYNLDMATRDNHPEIVVELEVKFSREEPYRSMGRYQHLIFEKSCGKAI